MRVISSLLPFTRARVHIGVLPRISYLSCRFGTAPNLPPEITLPGTVGSGGSSGSTLPCFLQINKFFNRIAVVDGYGSHRYQDIAYAMNLLTDRIADELNAPNDDTKGERICILCPSDISYVVAQLSAWMSGSISVPLSDKHPPLQLEYFIRDSQSRLVVTTEHFVDRLKPITDRLGAHLLVLQEGEIRSALTEKNTTMSWKQLPDRWSKRINRLQQMQDTNQLKTRRALIVYTSGTTGNPKGVVHTYGSIQAQVNGMIDRWSWDPSDTVLHVLPLHHVHGNINAMVTPLSCGACCVFLPNFDPAKVWSYLLNPPSENSLPRSINMLMAVPTMYSMLIHYFENKLQKGAVSKTADYVRSVCSSKVRLFISGSAPLPGTVMNRWKEITGHTMLERYGMTELGMVLTNPLNGLRKPGSVGKPFPFVEVCIAKPNVYVPHGYDVIAQGNSLRTTVMPGCENESGELYVRGPNVFSEYWNKPAATKETFTSDGWFKTGDTASYDDGYYRILGRTSVDIIKSGGYKISALDIERHLLEHPQIAEVAVVGVPDITWGQKVAAVVVLRKSEDNNNVPLTLDDLRTWSKTRLPSYQLPTALRIIDSIPRNALGKVNKKELVAALFKESK